MFCCFVVYLSVRFGMRLLFAWCWFVLRLGDSVSTVPATSAELELRAQLARVQAELDAVKKAAEPESAPLSTGIQRAAHIDMDQPIFHHDNQLGETQETPPDLPAAALTLPEPPSQGLLGQESPSQVMKSVEVEAAVEAGLNAEPKPVIESVESQPDQGAMVSSVPNSAQPDASHLMEVHVEGELVAADAQLDASQAMVVDEVRVDGELVAPAGAPKLAAAEVVDEFIVPVFTAMAPAVEAPAEVPVAAAPATPRDPVPLEKKDVSLPADSAPKEASQSQEPALAPALAPATLEIKRLRQQMAELQARLTEQGTPPPAPAAAEFKESDLPVNLEELDGTPLLDNEILELIQSGAQPGAAASASAADQPPGDKVNFVTHKNEGARMGRFMDSQEGKKFPHMMELWQGTPEETGNSLS